MKTMHLVITGIFFFAAMTLAWAAVDLGTYKGCSANDGEFKRQKLVNGASISNGNQSNGIVKMALVGQDDGSVDIFFIQKSGDVKRYNGKTGTTDSLGHINTNYHEEYGLVGIAIDPNFKTSSALYFTYTISEGWDNFRFHVSKIKLTPDRLKLDMASEKILLKIPAVIYLWHSSGAMTFDAYGDLYVAIGDNMQIDPGPGNTADLRGGILRIHPDDSPRGYSIPTGNFAEVFAAKYNALGNSAQGAEYSDTSKVKPEIFVKGTRNAYTIQVDPVRRWLVWGDVGPDQGAVSEEYNLVKEPVFAGWPYFAGEQTMAGVKPYDTTIPASGTKAEPINTSVGAVGTKVFGVKKLPAVREPIYAKHQDCAMTGPIFRYDGKSKGIGGFPPQFDRKWIISDCKDIGEFYFRMLTLNNTGDSILSNVSIFENFSPGTLVDMKQGSDGALYYVSWAFGIFKISYTGTCTDPTLVPESTGCTDPAFANYNPGIPKAYSDPRLCANSTSLRDQALDAKQFLATSTSLSINVSGAHTLDLLDIGGRCIWSKSGMGAHNYAIPSSVPPGIYYAKIKTPAGLGSRMLYRLGVTE